MDLKLPEYVLISLKSIKYFPKQIFAHNMSKNCNLIVDAIRIQNFTLHSRINFYAAVSMIIVKTVNRSRFLFQKITLRKLSTLFCKLYFH